ncbi:General substrate transporter [Corchorus olitorius]|uniref:General substrate transporter n=1 Tax=Corchorus olitorius TaxID=93759 RepID=A0A1R3IPB1_9ROSI|nr:General substrate transporter [Corchorus olitorius]
MSFRDDNEEGRDLKKPFLHTGSWYRMSGRQSSIMGSSAQVLRDGSVSVLFCVLIVALGPIQFGFTCGYSSPTQNQIIKDLNLTISESLMIAAIPNIIGWLAISFAKVPVYIAEIAPQNMRGSLGSVNQLSVTIGIMLAYLFGLFTSWRFLAVLGN